MKQNSFRVETNACWPRWTLALAALGFITLPSLHGEERETRLDGASLVSGTTLSGYVEASTIWALSTPPDSAGTAPFPNTLRMPGRLYDVPAKMDGFNLEAFVLTLEKPLDEESWSAGYRAQLFFGPDASLRNLFSLAGGGRNDLGLSEAFVTLRTPPGNGLEFRLGYFLTPLGYESYHSRENANVSRSYGYFIEPKQHTGLTMKYEFAEWMSAMAGMANNYSTYVDAHTQNRGSLTYLAALEFNGAWFGHKDITLKLGYTGGHTDSGAPTDTGPRIHNFHASAHLPLPVDGLALGLAYDYQANFSAGWPATFFLPEGPNTTYADATALYVSYAAKKWEFNTRAEYARATSGNTIFAARSAFGSDKPMFGGHDEKFVGVTETISYQLWKNVLTRVEFRWDHDCAGGEPVFGTAAHPRKNSFTIGFDCVYSF